MIPINSIEFPGQLFKIEANPGGTALALELRDPATRTVQLFWLELEEDGKWVSGPEMEWWCGLEALDENGLLVHRFEDPSLPIHRGLEWWALPGFDLQWRLPAAHLKAQLDSALWLGMQEGPDLIVDLETGIQKGTVTEETASSLLSQANDFQASRAALLQVPQPDWPLEAEESAIFEGKKPFTASVACLRRDEEVLLAWHTETSPQSFDLWMALLSKGAVQWTHLMEKNLSKLNPEPFFVLKDKVVWLQGPQVLCWRRI